MVDMRQKVQLFQKGDQGAFRALVEWMQDEAFRAAYLWSRDRTTAQDIVQIAFLKAWEKRSNLRNPALFKSWFYRILLNSYRDLVRNKSHSEQTFGLCADPVTSNHGHGILLFSAPSRSPEEAMVHRERQMELDTLIMALPELDRQILALRYGRGLKLSEVAAVLNLRQGTVRSRVHRALKHLRSTLTAQLSDEGR
ncbi:ECF RNA polymerase sigma factor SigW [Peptococcaceae bacterium CEB3]|nr:ECF RNA polymerase sigma factor SigW [Peptococcaceae bacterium CEB3]